MPYRRGDYRYVCPVTGKEVFFSETVRRWDGLRVSRAGLDPRHPQDDPKPKPPRPPLTEISAEASDGTYTEDGATDINADLNVPQYPYLQDENGEFILFSDGQPIEAPIEG